MTRDRWERIKQLFEETLERPPSERGSFIASQSADDHDMKLEVVRLISEYDAAGDFLESPPLPTPPHIPETNRTAFAPRARLGPYEILGLAGRGGMGDVYRARDTRLGRQVAIKVIGSAFEGSAEMRRRFDDEARLAARLDHPRICEVFDIGEDDGVRYFVMEFLEGESLSSRLTQGPLPISELLEYATEIASALAYAHRNNVVHRDIKPGNVFLTTSGVKVVDFGLATLRQQLQGATSSDDGSDAPRTRPRLVHGTPEYVAPERLEGSEGDHRSDIFAFGAVLYEMATGRRAFDGPTPADVIAAIMSSDPPPLVSSGITSPALEWVIRRCLHRKPDARWESMSDVETILKWLASSIGTGQTLSVTAMDGPQRQTGASHRSRTFNAVWLLVGAVVLAALGATSTKWASPTSVSSEPVVHFTLPVEPIPTIDFGVGYNLRLAMSRDGRRLAYVSARSKTTAIYVRQMASPVTAVIPGTDGATGVFFSPDGEHLGFFAAGKLKRVSLKGGPVLTICDVVEGAGATWGDDNTIIFSPSPMSALVRVSAAGGTPQPATVLMNGEVSHRWPEFLPGATSILYTAARDQDFTSGHIISQSLETNSRTELLEGTYPRYASTGHVVFARDASLFALPFDHARLRPLGKPHPIVTDVRLNNATGAALFAVSDSALIYRAAGVLSPERALLWVTTDGREESIPVEPRAFLQPRLSPDGTRVAISVGDRAQDRDVWIYDLVHHSSTRLTVEAGEDETPVWSPDGDQIAFSTARLGQPRMILTLPVNGGSRPTQLTSGPHTIHVSDWSPDGRAVAWTQFNPTSGAEVRTVVPDGSRPSRTLLGGPFDIRGAVFSPDGRWIAYTSNESGRDEVYVQPYPGPGSKWQISSGGGQEPVWSPTGKHLYFRGQARMMSVEVRTSPTFARGVQRVLFVDSYLTEHRGDRNYDVSADGRRFMMLKATVPFPPAELSVVLNWTTTVGRRE